MSTMFYVILSIVIAYFVVRLVVNVYYLKAKHGLQDGKWVSVLDSVNILMYIVIVLMLTLSLTMAGDYVDKELPIIGLLCVLLVLCLVIERVQLYVKHKKESCVFSYDIDLKKMSKSQDFSEKINIDRNNYFVKKEDWRTLKEDLSASPVDKSIARPYKKAVFSAISPLIPILLCVVVLVLGALRAQ